MPEDLFDEFNLVAGDEMQYSHYRYKLQEDNLDELIIEYDGTDYTVEIQDGQPVVVANE